MAYGSIGTISHATLRSKDLLTAFADELERLAALDAEEARAAGAAYEGTHMFRTDLIAAARSVDPDSDDAGEIINNLSDALNELAPPYCYFGAHAGDGADFGFWPDVESLEEDARDGDFVVKVNAGDDHPSGYDYIMSVSDHGNVTLYGHDGKEIWSVV
jgi:hypothetical protein